MEGFSAVLVNNTIIYLFHLQILRTVTCVFIVKGIVKKKTWRYRHSWRSWMSLVIKIGSLENGVRRRYEVLYRFLVKERPLSVGISWRCLHEDHWFWAVSGRNKGIGNCGELDAGYITRLLQGLTFIAITLAQCPLYARHCSRSWGYSCVNDT